MQPRARPVSGSAEDAEAINVLACCCPFGFAPLLVAFVVHGQQHLPHADQSALEVCCLHAVRASREVPGHSRVTPAAAWCDSSTYLVMLQTG
jgi:hypothetical protein